MTTGPLLMAAPTPMTVNDGTGSGFVSYRYSLSTGNEAGDPACGSVTVRESGQNASTVAGVNVDMAAVQTSVLGSVLTGTVRPEVASIVQQLWQTKNSAALGGLQGVYTAGVQSYTRGLTNAAASLQTSINARSRRMQAKRAMAASISPPESRSNQRSAGPLRALITSRSRGRTRP